MEQRIGPNSPPTPAAGVDPAYVPGLVPPPAAPVQDAAAGQEEAAVAADGAAVAVPGARGGASGAGSAGSADEADVADVADVADAPGPDDGPVAEDEAAEDAAGGDADGGDADAASGETGAEDEAGEEPEDDGLPVFEASDRRASVTADRAGVTFRLDSEVAEFGWDEIQAVEIDTPRFGRRFAVTVYTGPRRWFECDVEAPSRSDLKRWSAELDEVLDARFEEGGAAADAEEVADTAEPAEAAEAADAEKPEKAEKADA